MNGARRSWDSLEVGDDERRARAAWSAIAEPGDPVAGQLVAMVGPVESLRAVVERSESCLERFRNRLSRLDAAVLDPAKVTAGTLHAAALEGAPGQAGERLICPPDEEWPAGVNDLAVPPICLWVRGPLSVAQAAQRSVAVVGARAATAYGNRLASEIAAGLAERGFTVISGAALGIDGAAHRGALAVAGSTIAVLAGGLDRPYPAAHAGLIEHIAQVGALVSEVPAGSPPLRNRFLQRNRLIATMSQGTVVIEAGLRSGARNTAATAAQHHRVLAAVPGPVTSPESAGCHEMIRSGQAILVTDAAEVADAVGQIGQDLASPRRLPGRGAGPSQPPLPALGGPRIQTNTVRARPDLSDADRRLWELLAPRRARSMADLAGQLGRDEPATSAGLGRLELIGLARRTAGGWLRAGASARGQPS